MSLQALYSVHSHATVYPSWSWKFGQTPKLNFNLNITLVVTHISDISLPKSIINFGCKIIYLGCWRTSLESLKKILFTKFKDLKNETIYYVKKMAEFIGYPFLLKGRS